MGQPWGPGMTYNVQAAQLKRTLPASMQNLIPKVRSLTVRTFQDLKFSRTGFSDTILVPDTKRLKKKAARREAEAYKRHLESRESRKLLKPRFVKRLPRQHRKPFALLTPKLTRFSQVSGLPTKKVEAMKSSLERRLFTFSRCAKREWHARVFPQGTARYTFEVSGAGRISNVKLIGRKGKLTHRYLECVRRRLARLRGVEHPSGVAHYRATFQIGPPRH